MSTPDHEWPDFKLTGPHDWYTEYQQVPCDPPKPGDRVKWGDERYSSNRRGVLERYEDGGAVVLTDDGRYVWTCENLVS